MFRTALSRGVSAVALSAAFVSSAAVAQTTLPGINVGAAARRAAAPVHRPAQTAAPVVRAPAPARIAAPGPAPAPAPTPAPAGDRYTEPKPAPFSRTLPTNIPAVIESRTQAQIQKTTNVVTSADTFRYMPSIWIRERFIGDRNAVVSGRTTGTIQGAMTLVYADNVLLSNLLRNDFGGAPRWGMVSPAEISRVDVIYGPFSALYPGNSIGGVLTMTTRMPDNFEVHASGTGALQPYSLYTRKELNPTGLMNILVGNRINDFRYWIGYEYLDTLGQAQNYQGNIFQINTGTRFTGGHFDYNQEGMPRVITSATNAEHVQSHMAKVKLSYDIAPLTRLKYQAGFWNLYNANSVQPFIYDRNGVPIYNTQNGRIQLGPWAMTPGGVNPSQGGASHLMQALELRRDSGGVLDFDLSLTSYNFLRDYSNGATSYGWRANTGATAYNINPTGTNAVLDGTYWRTADARFVVRPQGDFVKDHEVSLGAHGDQYALSSTQTLTTTWPTTTQLSLQQVNYGKTQTVGMYLQDAWKFMPDWKAIFGGRYETWRAMDGSNVSGGLTANNFASQIVTFTPAHAVGAMFPDAHKRAFSPKAALDWQATPELGFRASIARAYRFPTVFEMFQALSTPNSVVVNNPNLQTEICTCYDFTTQYRWVDAFGGYVGLFAPRVSFFLDERWNAIVSQRTIDPLGRQVTANANIDRARFRGVEAAAEMRDILIKGLDFQGGVTLTDAKILNNFSAYDYTGAPSFGVLNTATPGILFAGRQFPRVPRIRVRAVATYSPNEDLSFSLGARYSSAAFVSLANTDFNHGEGQYGNVDSEILMFDAKARYRFAPNWTASVGVNNIGRWRAFVNPNPYPQRTFFFGINYDLGEPGSKSAAVAGLGSPGGPDQGGQSR
jgi:iron complex outermembrane receptor protein